MTKKIDKALILAAGRGTRMGTHAENLPKCFLSLGAETLLEFQVRALRSAGISQIGIVAGFKSELIKEFAEQNKLDFFLNADYASTNSLYSFFCAREYCDEGSLVLNSDVLFEPQLLNLLLNAPHENCLLFDPFAKLAEEEMKVCTNVDGIITSMGKAINPNIAQGENLGIVRYGPGTTNAAFETINKINGAKLNNLWLPESINYLTGIRPFHAISIAEGYWTEIDSAEDLEFARNSIYSKCC